MEAKQLRCPYCETGEVWSNGDLDMECIRPGSGGAPGCGAKWDACGYPLRAPFEQVAE